MIQVTPVCALRGGRCALRDAFLSGAALASFLGREFRPRFALNLRIDGAGLASFELGIQTVVLALQVAAIDLVQGEKLLQSIRKLHFGFLLRLARVIDAVRQDFSFGDAKLFHRIVVGARAAGEQQNQPDGQRAEDLFHVLPGP